MRWGGARIPITEATAQTQPTVPSWEGLSSRTGFPEALKSQEGGAGLSRTVCRIHL